MLLSILNRLCLGLAIGNWFQISKTGGFDKTSDYNSGLSIHVWAFYCDFNYLDLALILTE